MVSPLSALCFFLFVVLMLAVRLCLAAVRAASGAMRQVARTSLVSCSYAGLRISGRRGY